MDVDFKKLIEGIGEFASAYLQNFVGILISPNKTFETLLTSNSPDKFAIPQRRTIDTAAIRFAAISVVIGLLMAVVHPIFWTQKGPLLRNFDCGFVLFVPLVFEFDRSQIA